MIVLTPPGAPTARRTALGTRLRFAALMVESRQAGTANAPPRSHSSGGAFGRGAGQRIYEPRPKAAAEP